MKTLLRSALPFLILFGLALLLYFVVGPNLPAFHTKMLRVICISVVMAVSLNVVNGFTGQFSLGHAGFMAVGGYISGIVTYYGSILLWGSPKVHGGFLGSGDALFVASLLAGGTGAAICGYLVGLPSLRLRGDYLAIVTLGFGEIIRILLQRSLPVLSAEDVAAKPVWQLPRHVGGAVGFDGLPPYNSLFWAFLIAGIVVILCYRLKESIVGRAYLSIRENEVAAEAMGVPSTRVKVQAFVLAAFFAGVGGGLLAHEVGFLLNPRELGFQKSLEYVIMVVLGGMGSISGCVLAATVLTLLPEVLRDFRDYALVSYALLLALMMLLRPQGLFGIHELWEMKWFRRLFRRSSS